MKCSNLPILKPFTNIHHNQVKGDDGRSCLVIDGWEYESVAYGICIYYNTEEKHFDIEFTKEKGLGSGSDYNDEIKIILEEHGFEKRSGVFWTPEVKDEEDLKFLLASLCECLNEI